MENNSFSPKLKHHVRNHTDNIWMEREYESQYSAVSTTCPRTEQSHREREGKEERETLKNWKKNNNGGGGLKRKWANEECHITLSRGEKVKDKRREEGFDSCRLSGRRVEWRETGEMKDSDDWVGGGGGGEVHSERARGLGFHNNWWIKRIQTGSLKSISLYNHHKSDWSETICDGICSRLNEQRLRLYVGYKSIKFCF